MSRKEEGIIIFCSPSLAPFPVYSALLFLSCIDCENFALTRCMWEVQILRSIHLEGGFYPRRPMRQPR